MKEQEQKFVELRSQGWTFARIAAEIDLSRHTLITWSRKFPFEIQNLRPHCATLHLCKLGAKR